MFQTIIGISLVLLGIYFLDVFWGNGTTAKEGVHHSNARDSITGELKHKSSYTSSETKSLFP